MSENAQMAGLAMPEMELEGKVALVTGATKGIGLAIAWALATAGARVAICSRNQDSVTQAVGLLKGAGYDAMGIAAKVGEAGAADSLVQAVAEGWGRLDVLVNNAATNPVYGPLADTSMEAFDKILQVNVRGPFELSKKALPLLQKQGGSVINVASVAGLSPWEGIGAYSMSKTALIGLTKVMAKEWGGFGVRVNCICPGLIQTKFSKALWTNEAAMKQFKKSLALPRIGQPEDLMGLAVFLASQWSAYCTGSVFTVDGGMTI